MQTSTLTLYVDSQYASPWAMSVFVALQEKQLPHTLRTLDLANGQQHAADFSQQSLTARVPALMHNGFALSESTAITEYLDEVFAAPQFPALYPADAQGKARARQIQAWLRSDLQALRGERSTEVIFYRPTPVPLTASGRAAADKLLHIADRLITDGDANLFGTWCIADMDLAAMLQRLVSNGDAVPTKLQDYAMHQWARSSVQAWLKQERPPLEG